MTLFLLWLAVFAAFVLALAIREPAWFSEAHHAWYFSTLYWMAAALLAPGWLRGLALALCWLGMLDDAVEHWGGPSLVRWLYGKAGGTR